MKKFIYLSLSVLLSIILIACNDGSTTPETNSSTEPPELDVSYVSTSIVVGAAVVVGDGDKWVSWSNTATGQSGTAEVRDSALCGAGCYSVLCGCHKVWEAVIPLTDGANDILLTDGIATYSETIYHTDNGPPEVDGHSSTIDLGMPQWPPEVTVYFNEVMDASSINSDTFYVEDSDGNRVSGSPVVDTDGDKAIILMTGETDMVYTAIVTTGVTDYWGTPMSTEYFWDFEFSCGWAIYMGYSCP